MLDRNILTQKIKELVLHLSKLELDELFEKVDTLMRKEDVRRVLVEEYPGHISIPPDEHFNHYNLIDYEDKPFCFVEILLWYDNKESDLTASFCFNFDENNQLINIDFEVIGVQTYYNQNYLSEDWYLHPMEWMNVKQILSEIKDTVTGDYFFFQKNFLPIGIDSSGGGDYHYVDLNDDKLRILHCYHDDHSFDIIADSLEELLTNFVFES